MIINGVNTNKFRLKLGKPPFKIDPNNPGALEKLAEANKIAHLPVLMNDGTLVQPGEMHLYQQKKSVAAVRKTVKISTRKKLGKLSKTTSNKNK